MINYELDTYTIGLIKLNGYDIYKEVENYLKDYGPYAALLSDRPIIGTKAMYDEVFNKFPKYKGLQKYDMAFI